MSKSQPDTILAYTDGACSGNPGPAGIGVVLVWGAHRKEISEYIGEGTSNIAELTAVIRALEAIKDRSRHAILHSDSQYTIGMLAQGWKAKSNKELVERARDLVASFQRLRFEWVPGHAGVVENERCDQLARAAIRSRSVRANAGEHARLDGPLAR